MEASIPAEIDDGYLTLNISEKRFPAAHYMFTVTLLHDLPDDGTIQVYFPQSNFSDFSKFGCDLDY